MDIGIIGSGNIGSTLAKQLRVLGHKVSIANSRGPATLSTVAAETGATAVTVEQAALAKDIIIISIPYIAVPRLPLSILRSSSAVIVDTGNYYPTRDGAIKGIDDGLAESQWVASVLGRPVVKAFNNILATSLATRGTAAGEPGRICLSVAGDDVRAKKIVQDLIRDLGFDAIDVGSLADSWRQQPGTPAYCKDFDIKTLEAALAQASAREIESYRKTADDQAAPYLVPAPKQS
ncbi:hypothetical protein SAMN04244572_01795 [Azotobacter beijerinckii]|uniref:Pyrroline-5-carboxylate reductase catalytic N-terminal domain-containing protein n=1 Tax=Azotobacter beijerinckii TaxID=170623 RepID=A0A1H6TTS8_9GAMM|nr:NAD(P)-binding domain-containing protein [Azotobacter beijerinckii]SEI82656.1 hypothetical protein SAMN04244572_01795 [Azotobacter beijerinckii]SEJ07150.1 hypothetical protein SAMN04244579_03006 [Azotobacter beijerinckii]